MSNLVADRVNYDELVKSNVVKVNTHVTHSVNVRPVCGLTDWVASRVQSV